MSRHDDFELWREVTATTVGLTGIVELFAKRVRRADRLDLARQMIEHADELAARAERQKRVADRARLEGEAKDGARPPQRYGRVAPEPAD
ncbi:MAG: hypothetical protein ACRDPQ_21355 [Nocardioidaceae bacterium]